MMDTSELIAHFLSLVVDLKRRADNDSFSTSSAWEIGVHVHLSKGNDFSFLCRRIHLHNAKRSADPKGAIKDIDSENDGVPLGKRGNDLESTRPDSLRSCIPPLRFRDLSIVSRERVKQMVDDVGCNFVSHDLEVDMNSSSYL